MNEQLASFPFQDKTKQSGKDTTIFKLKDLLNSVRLNSKFMQLLGAVKNTQVQQCFT